MVWRTAHVQRSVVGANGKSCGKPMYVYIYIYIYIYMYIECGKPFGKIQLVGNDVFCWIDSIAHIRIENNISKGQRCQF